MHIVLINMNKSYYKFAIYIPIVLIFIFKNIFLTALKDKILNNFIELFKTVSLNHPCENFPII